MIQGKIGNRLYNQELPPPPGAWEAIARALDGEEAAATAAPVISMPAASRGNRWLRWALAASVLGFIAMTTLWLLEKNQTTTPKDGQGATAAANPPATPGGKEDTGTAPVLVRDTVYLPAPGNNTNPGRQLADNSDNGSYRPPAARNNQPAQPGKTPGNRKNDDLADNNPANPPGKNLQPLQNPVTGNNPALAQAQMKDSSGKVIRGIDAVRAAGNDNIAGPGSKGDKSIISIMSRISQASDREALDSIIRESPYWKLKIQQWREKLIQSGFAPSIINHLDLLELQKLLDDEKKP